MILSEVMWPACIRSGFGRIRPATGAESSVIGNLCTNLSTSRQTKWRKTAITAICNGLNTANELNEKEITQLIVIGGNYHKYADVFESIGEHNTFKNIRAQKAFIGAFGVNIQAGLTSGSFFISSLRKELIDSVDQVILLADSSKFGKIECAHFADLEEIDIIITDNGLTQSYIDQLNDLEIELILV